VTLSITCPVSENVAGTVVGIDVSAMLSSPIGFRQHGAAELISVTESVSMASAGCGFAIVRKRPNVFGSVSVTVNTVPEFLSPFIVYGIVVVLE